MDSSSSQPAVAGGSLDTANVWIGLILALILVSCLGCLASCCFYYKMKRWRRTATVYPMVATLTDANLNDERFASAMSLPNYTLVSGLPSYDEALEQHRRERIFYTYTGHYFTYSGRMRSKRGSIKDLLENSARRASVTPEPAIQLQPSNSPV